MKKIFFDASALSRKRTGIENVTFNLLKVLLETDKVNEYFIVFRKFIDPEIALLAGENVRLILSRFNSQILTEQVFIPLFIIQKKPEISVFCCFPPGYAVAGKIAIYCHDATNWRFKEYLSWKNRLYFKPLTERALRRATVVFTNSYFSSEDIRRYFKGLNKVPVVLSPALNNKKLFISKPDDSLRENLIKFGITKNYLLCVGSLEPRKNVEFVIKNIDKILVKYDLQLVLTGRKAWGKNSIDNAIHESPESGRIIKTGFISNEQLHTLYSFAEMFLFPSRYEGFGLPILEAFACGCPVITSNVSSMPEVAGNAALYIDPDDVNGFRSAVMQLLSDNKLRKTLVENGLERQNAFSWEKSADVFREVIESL